MANYVDQLNLNGNVADFKGVDGDQTYTGTDLTVKFAAEIAGYPDVWTWIQARIKAADFSKIHVGDYIPFTCTNGTKVNAQIAGIDTYYRYGDQAVGHHIDFISRELWPTTVKMNPVNINNGVDKEHPYPFLCSNAYAYLNSLAMDVPNSTTKPFTMTAVDYTTSGVLNFLPTELKSKIVEKRAYMPQRQSDSGVLNNDNSAGWTNMGKLWLPDEMEISGARCMTTLGWWAGGFVQYPIFANNMNRLKNLGVGGGRSSWWAASAYSGASTNFVYVTTNGQVACSSASNALGVPVCFRIS